MFDWCICGPTHRALKQGVILVCSGHNWGGDSRLNVVTHFLKHRTSGPKLSISQFVRLSVHVSLLLRYRLNIFLPPLPEIGCPIFLEIQNPWGKVMERSGLRLEHFCLEVI